jgi:hypothetical protein
MRAHQAPTRAQYDDDYDNSKDYIEALVYHNEEVKDDSDDYRGHLPGMASGHGGGPQV